MKLKPLMTEKSLELAKDGVYTFWVGINMTKSKIKELISEVFEVQVKSVKTINYKKRREKNYLGRFKTIKAKKKAIVTLKGKDKIKLFDTKK